MVLASEEWRSGAYARYLDEEAIDHHRIIWAAMESSDREDGEEEDTTEANASGQKTVQTVIDGEKDIKAMDLKGTTKAAMGGGASGSVGASLGGLEPFRSGSS